MPQTEIQSNYYFPCGVYTVENPTFIEPMLKVSKDYIKQSKKKNPELNEIYPVRQTDDFVRDKRIAQFNKFIGDASWNILDNQGYAMNNYYTTINEVWCQEHHKFSGHEQHIHGSNAQMCGFYFLESEEDAVKALIHDPRGEKVYASLPQKKIEDVTLGTNVVNFNTKPGTFIFINAWMPHSFTKNKSNKPFRFIHFNIGVQYIGSTHNCNVPAAEVI